ncbi:hypothetical protein [Pseudomonas japonica]|uniref:hypothetical protein n=1 Tax=Pseudomonas japonica TaxID=256466 RepID=UPI0005A6A33B|nr:hypothetical protein [Pseudomonas japonica]
MKVDFSRWSLDAASRSAQREALVNVERGRRYTHLELHRLTNRIAHMVKQRLYLAADRQRAAPDSARQVLVGTTAQSELATAPATLSVTCLG